MSPDSDAALLAHLAALEAELHHPGSCRDRARLEALLHPDFHEIGRSGAPWSREQVVAWLAARTTVPPVVPSHHRLVRLGEDAALLTYASQERPEDGAAVRAAMRSSVWQRTAAGWQLRYHQGTPALPDGR